MIAEQVSHYKILGRLGAGAMGEVFHAEDVRLGRQVALKFIRSDLLHDARSRQRMEFEARAAAILNHPHITTLYEFDAENGFLSFEFVEGTTWEDKLAEPISALSAVQTSLAICRGLAHAHGRNVVHRDLKPANVLIGKDGSIKLSDFGLAKVRDALAQATQEIVQGTPAYLAPERISGQGSDHRGDLFSLGVMIFRAITGRLPWPGESLMEVLFAVIQHEPEPLDLVVPDAPPALVDLVTKLLEKEPEHRLGSANLAETYLLEAEAWLVLPADKRGPARAAPAAPKKVEPKPPSEAESTAEIKPIKVGAVGPDGEKSELPFVGRDEMLIRFDRILGEAEAGHGRPVLIRGTAGSGKTRFVREAERRNRGRRILFLHGRAQQHGNRNFGALVDALEGFARGIVDGGDRYLADLSSDTEALGALLPTLQLLLDDTPAGGQPRTREELWFLLESLLKRIAEVVPLVLVVDDLHWADEGTVALAWHLAKNLVGSRLILLGLYRPEELIDPAGRTRDPGEMVHGLQQLEELETLELGSLGEAGTAALVRAAFPASPLAASLTPLIHRRAQGNPLFTVEIIRLIGSPDPTQESDGSIDDTTRSVMPRNIADVVARRLLRLTNEEREILDVAAVEGFVFHADVVGEATGMPRLKLLSRLRDLNRTHDLIEPTGEGYRFTQGLIREVLLKELPADLKLECHKVVASYLLQGYSDRADYAGPIAGHLYRAERFAEALPYLWRAAAEARRLFLYDRALIYLDRGIESQRRSRETSVRPTQLIGARSEVLLKLGRPADARQAAESMLALATADEGHPDRPEAEELVGEAALEQGDYDAAEKHLTRAHDTYVGDESALTGIPRSDRKLAALAFRRGDFETAVARYREARDRLEASGDRLGVAEIRMEMALLLIRRGDIDEALRELETAIPEFRALGDRHGEARTLTHLGSLLRTRGRLDEALLRYEEALPVAGRIGDRQGVAVLQANIGNVHLSRGELDRAHGAYEEALGRFRSIGDHRGEAQTLVALGNVSFLRDRYEEAADWYRQSLTPRETMGDRWGLANSLDNLGVAEYRLARLNEARTHILHARTVRDELHDRPGCAESSLNLGALLLVLGDATGAAEAFGEALRLAEEIGDRKKEVRARLGRAIHALVASEPAAARDELREASARGIDDPVLIARSLLLEAMAADEGDSVLSGERFTQAVNAADQSGSLPEVAAARLALGRRHLASDPARAGREAHAVFELLPSGAIPLLEIGALRLMAEADPGVAAAVADRIDGIAAGIRSRLPAGAGSETVPEWAFPILP